MPDGPLLRSLHAALGSADPAPDAELLRRFAAVHEHAAFELIVRRHADMVWRVCRGILKDAHAAEDAFQATFLVLARRPTDVSRGSVAGWLFRVARNAALRARRRARPVAALPDLPGNAVAPDDVAATTELTAIVADEVARLADKFREPVVLCFYEGYTHAEAAARLGWAVGTVASRLARAKDRLRDRLVRRGVALPAALAVLSAPVAAAVPPGLVRLCVATTTGPATVPAPVLAITEGVLSAMPTVHRSLVAAAALLIGLAAGGSFLAVQAGNAPKDANAPRLEKPVAADPPPKQRVADPLERARSRRALAQVADAISKYHQDQGHLPTDIHDPKTGKAILSWRVAVLPYMEQRNLHRLMKLDEPWDSPGNKAAASPAIKAYAGALTELTDKNGYGLTQVRRLTGPGTLHEPGNKVSVPADLTVRWRTALLVVEAGEPTPWAKPDDIAFDPKNPPTLVGPFSNVVHAATLTLGMGWSLRPNLKPGEVAKLAVREGDIDWRTFEGMTLTTGPDDAEYKAALDQHNELSALLQRAERIARLTQAEDARRRGIGAVDAAAELGFRSLELAERFMAVLREIADHPVVKQNKQLREELDQLIEAAKALSEKRKK